MTLTALRLSSLQLHNPRTLKIAEGRSKRGYRTLSNYGVFCAFSWRVDRTLLTSMFVSKISTCFMSRGYFLESSTVT